MAGRPPKPTALKLLQGNPGKRKLNTAEPNPSELKDIPAFIQGSPVLLAEWNRQAPRLKRLGILKDVDDGALAAICVLEVRFRDLVANDAAASSLASVSKELRALWSRFGMTPADRVRIKVEKPAEKDALAEYEVG